MTGGLHPSDHLAEASDLLGQVDLILPQFLHVLLLFLVEKLQLQLLLLLQELVHLHIFRHDDLLTRLRLLLLSHVHINAPACPSTRAHMHTRC